jgi:hypothetical protein
VTGTNSNRRLYARKTSGKIKKHVGKPRKMHLSRPKRKRRRSVVQKEKLLSVMRRECRLFHLQLTALDLPYPSQLR